MGLSKRNYDEKRNYIRMKVNTPIALEIEDNDQPTINGICRNLSGGGMLVEAPAVFPVGTSIKVALSSPHGHEPMLTAHTQVRRVENSGQTNEGCCIGLEIIEMLE